MIPQRIALGGFLCYRDAESIDFSGSSLWMLAGLNGSGKSAVFDAVTYALFGCHRGGATNATELINKDSDSFTVEFEFLHDGVPHRIRRTLKKTAKSSSATQQIARHDDDKWVNIPETSKRKEFDAWVANNLGLGYETFTSSVLLLQGRAEKLLASSNRDRFEVLAGIVDLGRYGRLHERADERRKLQKARLEAVRSQLAAVPPAEDAEFAATQACIDEAVAAQSVAEKDVERWRAAEFQSQRYRDVSGRAESLSGRVRQAKTLIAGADNIERDAARYRELFAVVPQAVAVIKLKQHIAETDREAAELRSQLLTVGERLLETESAHNQASQKRIKVQTDMGRDESRLRELAVGLQTLAGKMSQVEQLDRQRLAVSRLETDFARLPSDLDVQVEQLARESDELAVVAAAVPVLTRLRQIADELQQAVVAERTAAEAEQSIRARGEELKAEIVRLGTDLTARAAERQLADEAASAAQALLQQARTEAELFRGLEGARVCRSCGQSLTPDHFDREMAKRDDDVKVGETHAKRTAACRKAARALEDDLRSRIDLLERERQEKRDAYRDATNQRLSARQLAERLTRDRAAAEAEVPEAYRASVGELEELRSRAAKASNVRERLRQLTEQHVQWAALKRQINDARNAVKAAADALGGDPEAIRADYIRSQDEESSLTKTLFRRRDELKAVEAELARLAKERESRLAERAAIEAKASGLSSTMKHAEMSLATTREALPPSWRAAVEKAKLSDQHAWKAELDALAMASVAEKAEQLRQALASVATLERELATLEAELAGFGDDAKLDANVLRERLAATRHTMANCEAALLEAHAAQALLVDRRNRRRALEDDERSAERDHVRTATLAALLGPRRLQLYLVRRAERQIVEHANAVLDRLSGGQLFLRLCSGDEGDVSEKALELEVVNHTTADAPINIAFLSGSQRFRVAVSLALGIGQYASRQHRPIESVIIDEGFGCLDRNGRQVMIQELQNLRGHLKCILLVSHQEEFAEAFSDGYRFELEDGTTRVKRVQR